MQRRSNLRNPEHTASLKSSDTVYQDPLGTFYLGRESATRKKTFCSSITSRFLVLSSISSSAPSDILKSAYNDRSVLKVNFEDRISIPQLNAYSARRGIQNDIRFEFLMTLILRSNGFFLCSSYFAHSRRSQMINQLSKRIFR